MTITEDRLVDVQLGHAEDRPRDVVAALARVMGELGGIDKLTPQDRARRGIGGGETGISYAYRGIDQIAGAAQPLLGKYGVVIVPKLLESRITEITVNNRPWSDTWVRVHWVIYGPGGKEDWIDAVTEGLGRDNADKGQNKAMTSAAKNLLLRLLMIGDPGDDSDGHTAERDQHPAAAPPEKPQPLSDKWKDGFKAKVEAEGFDVADVMYAAFGNSVPNPLMPEHIPTLRDALEWTKRQAEKEAQPEPELPLDGDGPPTDDGRPASRAQIARIKAEYTRVGYGRAQQLDVASKIAGRKIDTHNLLTFDEAEVLLGELGRVKVPTSRPDPIPPTESPEPDG